MLFILLFDSQNYSHSASHLQRKTVIAIAKKLRFVNKNMTRIIKIQIL